MGFVIERHDGSTDGMGDRVVYASEAEAWDDARHAFGDDPASAVGGVEAWLQVKWVADKPTCGCEKRSRIKNTVRKSDPAWAKSLDAMARKTVVAKLKCQECNLTAEQHATEPGVFHYFVPRVVQ